MLITSTNAPASTLTKEVWAKPFASTLTNEVPLVKVDATTLPCLRWFMRVVGAHGLMFHANQFDQRPSVHFDQRSLGETLASTLTNEILHGTSLVKVDAKV